MTTPLSDDFLARHLRELEESRVVQTTSDFAVIRLGADAALLTYRIHRHSDPPVHTLRSSVWRRTARGWTMRFHQATRTGAAGQERT